MNDAAETATAGAAERKAEQEMHLSKDGKWKSFPKVPNLLQKVSTDTYFARVKVDGKVIRQSLNMTVFTTAKEKLRDFLKEQKEPPGWKALRRCRRQISGRFGTGSFDSQAKRYRKYCVNTIKSTWLGIEGMNSVES